MADRFYELRVGQWARRLSLAVKLVDAVTGGRPVGDPTVRIDGVDAEPVENPSGYRVFSDLPADTATLVVDGGDPYVDVARPDVAVVDLAAPGTDVDPTDPESLPVETVELQPAPAYRFPAGTTRVRGHVRDAQGNPVDGATVSVRHLDRAMATGPDGEFVLFFDPSADDDVSVSGGGVEVTGSDPTLVAAHPDLGTTTGTLPVPEGERSVLALDYD